MAVLRFRRPSSRKAREDENEPIEERDSIYEPDASGDYDESDDFEEEPEEEAQEEESPRIPRRQIILAGLRILLVGVVLGIIISLILASADRRNYTAAEFRASVPVQTIQTAKYRYFDGVIFGYSKDGASAMDVKGKTLWQVSYEMQRPILSDCRSKMAMGDYGGGKIYLLDSHEGLVSTISTNMPIRSLSVSEKGYVAAVLGDTEVTWVYVFDSQGQTVAYIKRAMGVSGYPVDISLSPSGRLLACSQTAADNMSIKTSVAFYNFGAVGKNSVDNNVSGYNYVNEIAPFVQFVSDEACVAATDRRLAFFEGSEVPQGKADIMFTAELSGVWTGDTYCALLFPDATGEEAYSLEIYNFSGDLIGKIPFSMEFTDIMLHKDRVIIHDGQRVLIYSAQGEKRYEGSFGNPVLAVIPTDGASRYYLLEENSIAEMVLR